MFTLITQALNLDDMGSEERKVALASEHPRPRGGLRPQRCPQAPAPAVRRTPYRQPRAEHGLHSDLELLN